MNKDKMKLPDNIIPLMFHFMEKKTGFFLFLLFFAAVIDTIVILMLSHQLKLFVDKAYELGDLIKFADFYILLAETAALFLVFSINSHIRIIGWQKGRLPYEMNMRKMLFSFVNNHSHSFFANNQAGNIAHKIIDAAYSFVHLTANAAFNIFPAMIMIILSCFWFYPISPDIAFVAFAWGVIYVSFTMVFVKYSVTKNRARAKAKSETSGIIVDAITNNMAVRMFSAKEDEKNMLAEKIKEEEKYTCNHYATWRRMIVCQQILLFAFFMFVISYVVKDIDAGNTTVGQFAMVTTLLLVIILRIDGLGENFMMSSEYIGAIRSAIALINKPLEVQDIDNASDLVISDGRIEIKDVKFNYSEDEGNKILDDFNLIIPPRQKIGFVGSSGVGKSTVMNLILRLYDIENGVIEIDGQDVSKVKQTSLHSCISVIPQDTILFHRSLMENIRYGNKGASDADVINAAKKAFAHDFICKLPEQYETLVGERGVKLSGGQRQRVAIARAILKDAPILILDEATSALDSESEALIQESLKELMGGKTVIAIAHRLSTINQLDRLIVMDDGKIIEDGTHRELLDKKGLYAKLWSMQSGGFLAE